MKKLVFGLMVVCGVALRVAAGSDEAYRENVVTPHWEWEGVHTGGTVRALFLVNAHALRQVDELAQRFDLSCEALPVGGRTIASMECDGAGWAALSTQRWDLVALASSTAWTALGITNQEALIESMKAGQRVVVYDPQQGEIDNLKALMQEAPLTDRASDVFRALPSDWLRFRVPFKFTEYAVGKGRLFFLDRIDTHWTFFNAFMGQGVGGQHAPAWYEEPVTPELFYAAVGRWIRLAAGRASGPVVSLHMTTLAASVPLNEPVTCRFTTTAGASSGDKLEWFLYSSFGDELARESVAMTQDSVETTVTPSQTGRLLLRWRWRRGDVTLDWGADSLLVSNPLAFASLDIPGVVTAERPVELGWTLVTKAPEGAKVNAHVFDSDGRLVSWAEGAAGAGRLRLPGWISRGLAYELRLFLREGNTVYDERRLALYGPHDRAADRLPYHVILWGTERGEYTDLFRFERLRQLGITALATIGVNSNLNRIAVSRGLRVVPTNILVPPNRYKKRFDKAEEDRRLGDFAAGVAPLSPLAYSLADEPSGVDPVAFRAFGAEVIRRHDPQARVGYCGVWEGFNRNVPAFFEACDFAEPYSPFHLYTPNLWMGCERDLYRSFKRPDAIVTCWTHYAPWLDSEPYSRTPPWLWLFEGLSGVSYFDSAGEFAVLPGDLRTTHETRWWSEEMREIRNGIGEQLLAATRDAGAVRVLFHPNAAGAASWARAFNETRVPFRFVSHADLERGLEPGVRLLVCPNVPLLSDRELAHIQEFVKAGGTLVATAPFGRYRPGGPPKPEPQLKVKPDSPKDINALLDAIDQPVPVEETKEPDPMDPWIREIGTPPNPVPEPAEPDRLAVLCGVRYGAVTGAVPMASLGVTRRAPEAAGVPVALSWTAPADGFGSLTGATLGVSGFEPAGSGKIVAAMRETAEATNSSTAEIAEVRATPGVIENAYGKGHSWFFAMQPDVPTLRDWIPALTAAAAVPNPGVDVRLVEGSNDTVYAYRFADGPIQLMGVVQDYWKVGPAWTVEGGLETVAYFKHGPSIWAESPAVLTVGEARHLYDVRRGRYLGSTNRVEFALQPGRPELFALLPYEVTDLVLTAPKEGRPGEALELRVQVKSVGLKPGDHVVHVELADPSGRVVEADRYNLRTAAGDGRIRLPLAWNAAPGAWTVTARDSISGRSAQAVVNVKPAAPLFRPWRKEALRVERLPLAWPDGKVVPVAVPGG